ncbi:hypothetical protein [Streptomyces sp. NPDC047130]|uniref:hypothetical protein n=1 Tax=Streptomyces sp. NPDC047130 TaxID=3155261 RepID=UPI0033E32D97
MLRQAGGPGLEELTDVRIDGVVARGRSLRGEPEPDTLLGAVRDLDAGADARVMSEDALVGMDAGRAGRFGCVVGVDRTGRADVPGRHSAGIVAEAIGGLLGVAK